MACEFICDGCGEREPGQQHNHRWFKPSWWFERSDEDGIQTVCSRRCIEIVAEKTGKTKVVLPV